MMLFGIERCRPQEPHSLRQSAVTGDVPSMSEVRLLQVTETGIKVKAIVTFKATVFVVPQMLLAAQRGT
jgi:hypothetical protein